MPVDCEHASQVTRSKRLALAIATVFLSLIHVAPCLLVMLMGRAARHAPAVGALGADFACRASVARVCERANAHR